MLTDRDRIVFVSCRRGPRSRRLTKQTPSGCSLSLADNGKMPFTETFISSRVGGMVADRFGVSWMTYVAP